MDANWKLLADLVKYNREHGDKTDTEVVNMFMDAYSVLNECKDDNGKINVEYALNKLNSLIESEGIS